MSEITAKENRKRERVFSFSIMNSNKLSFIPPHLNNNNIPTSTHYCSDMFNVSYLLLSFFSLTDGGGNGNIEANLISLQDTYLTS